MYEFGKFRFDPANRLLLSEGNPVPLTPKALEILLVLVQNGSRLTTKEELMRKVWPDSFVEEANLTVNISALRKLLGETPDGEQYIETVPKSGYRFVALVKDIRGEALPASLQVEDFPAGTPPPSRMISRKTIWLSFSIPALGLLFVAIVGLSYVAFRGRTTRRPPLEQPRRLAILPFRNLQANPNDDFLALSLSDAIITKLGYVSALTVRPSYAVQKYTARSVDIPKVAADLDVDTLLTGTFIREGDNLRIACQLIDVKTRSILWKGAFDLKFDKLLTVQDKVSEQIIQGLELTLSPAEAERLKPEVPINPLAYEYYLRGVDLYSRGDFPMSVKMLEESSELAPTYALTWANLGKAYTASASFRFGGSEQYRKAQAAFERALSLQPEQIEARIYMANMLTDTGRVESAVPLLRQALKTNPNYAETHWELGYAYRFAGMLQESVAECERARQFDPSVKLTSSMLNSYLYLGQYDRFLASLPKADDQALVMFYRGLGEYYKKNSEQASADFDRAFELDPSTFQSQIGKAVSHAIRGHKSQAALILRSAENRVNERSVGDPETIYKMAQAYAILGDKASGLRVLRQSIQNGFFPYPYLTTDPLLNALRSADEFSRLLNLALQRHQAFKQTFF